MVRRNDARWVWTHPIGRKVCKSTSAFMTIRQIPIRDDTDTWNDLVLQACRRSWNRPDMTMDELRAKLDAPVQPNSVKSDDQFDVEREAEQAGITTARYLREN